MNHGEKFGVICIEYLKGLKRENVRTEKEKVYKIIINIRGNNHSCSISNFRTFRADLLPESLVTEKKNKHHYKTNISLAWSKI